MKGESGAGAARREQPRMRHLRSRLLGLTFGVVILSEAASPGSAAPTPSIYVGAFRTTPATRILRPCPAAPPTQLASPAFAGPELQSEAARRVNGLIVDSTLQATIEREFARRRRFRLSASAKEADYVLFVEAVHSAVIASGPAGSPPRSWSAPAPGRIPEPPMPRSTLTVASLEDEIPNLVTSLSAFVVQPSALGSGPAAFDTLLRQSLWQAVAHGVNFGAASPQALIDRLHSNLRPSGSRRLAWIVSDGDQILQEPGPGTALCVTPQPALAPAAAAFSTAVVGSRAAALVPVEVVDGDGIRVTGLTAGDFRLYEDGVEQKIDRVLPSSEAVDLALVVDTSASMRFSIPRLQESILALVDALRGQDRVMLASFDSRVFVQVEPTSDRGRLRRAVMQVASGEGTRLYDAIDLLANAAPDRLGERRAIVLLTDGIDTQSRLATEASSRELVSALGLPVYVIRFDAAESSVGAHPLRGGTLSAGESFDAAARGVGAEQYLQSLVDASGGLLFRAETIASVQDTVARIAAEISRQYVLGYYPSNQARDGAYRAVRVEVARPGARVRARPGYRAASPARVP